LSRHFGQAENPCTFSISSILIKAQPSLDGITPRLVIPVLVFVDSVDYRHYILPMLVRLSTLLIWQDDSMKTGMVDVVRPQNI